MWGKFGAAVEGSCFDTDGFPIVIANERGPIDNNAQVDYKNFNLKADYRASDRVSAVLPRRLLQGGPRQRQGWRGQ